MRECSVWNEKDCEPCRRAEREREEGLFIKMRDQDAETQDCGLLLEAFPHKHILKPILQRSKKQSWKTSKYTSTRSFVASFTLVHCYTYTIHFGTKRLICYW